MSARRRRKRSLNWVRQIAQWMDASESRFPEPAFLKGDWPQWVQRVGRELMATMFPAAKLKVGPEWSASEVGALLGHRLGYLHALEHYQTPEVSKVFKKLDKRMVRRISKQVGDFQRAFELALERSLGLASAQSHADAAQFFAAFAKGINRVPADIQASNFQRTTTKVYVLMLVGWRSVERLRSVRELQQALCRHLDTHVVGDIKRIEKLCQRIGLRFGPRGRPRARADVGSEVTG